MLQDLEQLIALQGLDAEIALLEGTIATIPGQIRNMEQQLIQAKAALEKATAEVEQLPEASPTERARSRRGRPRAEKAPGSTVRDQDQPGIHRYSERGRGAETEDLDAGRGDSHRV
ncbi:MAG: hypothetical protein M5R38_13825 [Candidatus Methylomirabilis sp.]|nr:hypothetical protein [Candidatus Methylomirabilis sp.]